MQYLFDAISLLWRMDMAGLPQDELFTQTYLLSLLRTQQKDKAHQFFSKHLSHYQNTPLAELWFN